MLLCWMMLILRMLPCKYLKNLQSVHVCTQARTDTSQTHRRAQAHRHTTYTNTHDTQTHDTNTWRTISLQLYKGILGCLLQEFLLTKKCILVCLCVCMCSACVSCVRACSACSACSACVVARCVIVLF